MFRVEKLKSEHARRVETILHKNLVKVVDCEDSKNFCILPEGITKNHLAQIKWMKIYEDDIWIVTNPKSGTTWTQEMVWMIFNNLDYDQALKTELDDRVPFIELEGLTAELPMKIPTFQMILYVARNANDAAVSWFHHHVNFHLWHDANMETFINSFVNDRMLYSPYNDHVLKFWEIRNEPNVIFLHFEDMKRNLKEVVEKVAAFLGKSYSSEEYDKLCEHLKFESMQSNKAINKADLISKMNKSFGSDDNQYKFIRKGKVGSHKEELTLEQIEMLDSYVKQIDSDKTDFKYKFN